MNSINPGKLAHEYRVTAQQLSERLAQLRQSLRETSDFELGDSLTRRIAALELELTDLNLVARHLEGYDGN